MPTGITPPTPTQSGVVKNCAGYHTAVPGDGCWDLAAAHGIFLARFYEWNPEIWTSLSDSSDFVVVYGTMIF